MLAVTGALLIATAGWAASALSPAQEKVIAQKTAKVSAEEKKMIAGWSDGKKLAEFFCAPAGLAEFKKTSKAADRVFLGPDDEGVKQFVLVGNSKLSGRGSVRMGADWKDFTFQCTLDPDKGTATSFTYELTHE